MLVTDVAELQLLEMDGKKDKMDKLTVLMSTSHVDLLIDSCISSIIFFLTHDLVQVVLTSTFSFFVFSFFSFSCPKDKSLAHEASSTLPFFPANHTTLAATRSGAQGSKQTTFPHSGRVERPAARGKGRRVGAGRRRDGAEDRDGGATLASPPPCPRPAHQQQHDAEP